MEMEIRFPGGKKVEAKYDTKIILTDQPVDDGGEGSAPAPFDLFIASIGTCTGYYVLSFCQKNNIPTDQIKLITRILRNPTTYMVEDIQINIQVPKNFPEKYKNAVVKAAAVCSVKRHLEQPPQINISVTRL
jgi:putative redox protein